jgi:YD repeat-containing protein
MSTTQSWVRHRTSDPANELSTRSDGGGNTFTSHYDGAGNLTEVEDPRGLNQVFVHDNSGRLRKLVLWVKGAVRWVKIFGHILRRRSGSI